MKMYNETGKDKNYDVLLIIATLPDLFPLLKRLSFIVSIIGGGIFLVDYYTQHYKHILYI